MKNKCLLIILLTMIFMPFKVFAAGGFGVSSASVSMYLGESKSIAITSSNAVGRLNISSSNGGIASVNTGSIFIQNPGSSENITITGNSVGTTTIIVVASSDFATMDEEILSGQTRTITVNVLAKPAPNNSVAPSASANSSRPNSGYNSPVDDRSSNTGLSKLTVNGKELSNSNNVYSLEVGNYIDKVSIDALAADSKCKVTGIGNKDLVIGENKFDIVVTAENGTTTTYIVNVVRKEYNVYSDLDELLKLDKDVEIIISDNDKYTKSDLDKIIKSKKKITLTKVSNDNKILYSFILNGSNIKSVKEFNPNINLLASDNEKMEEALNYADGILLDFSECGDLPKGIILKYFVGDKYKNKDKVNLYVYNEKTKEVIQLDSDIIVVDGFVELEISESIKYFISKAKVLNAESEEINIWFITSICLVIVIVFGSIFLVVNKIKTKKKINDVTDLEEEII